GIGDDLVTGVQTCALPILLTMDAAVRNVMKFAEWDLQQAVRLATLNPARVTGLDARGTLTPGARADIVVLSAAGEVKNTIIGGEIGRASCRESRESEGEGV